MLHDVFTGLSPVVQAVVALSLTAIVGLAIGSVKIRGVGLGIGGVLFAGIIFGHFGLHGEKEVMEFLREFGLILFVYTIGVQVGPGFFSTLKKAGLGLNLMAASIVVLGAIVTCLIYLVSDIELPVVLGLFSGAVTNTPSLAAGQQMLMQMGVDPQKMTLPGMGYAVAYPFGIAGILLTMGLVRLFFRIRVPNEIEAFKKAQSAATAKLDTLTLRVTNRNLDGKALRDVPGIAELGVVVSRLVRPAADGNINLSEQIVPQADTKLHVNDMILVVGSSEKLEEMRIIVGEVSDVNLKAIDANIRWERIVVTNTKVLNKSVAEVDLLRAHGVVISRVTRAGIELVPSGRLGLQFGDILTVIGTPENIKKAASTLGNSQKVLSQAQVIPIFVGMMLGVLLGSIPIAIPGMPAALKLGLAGGPLVVALILSRIGSIGPLVWFMPPSANHILREIGIVLFLAVVGLKSGQGFFDVLLHGDGFQWMAWATLITLVPLVIVGTYARLVAKTNYLTICGLLSGSMTDPPALAFANAVAPSSEAPSLAYATVYPLVMCLRILAPQIMVLLLWGL